MAGKLRRQFSYNVAPGVCLVSAEIPIGSAGAVGTVVGKGIKSVSRTGTGALTVNFNDRYLGLASFAGAVNTNPDGEVTPPGADGYLLQLDGSWNPNTVSTVNGGDGYAKVQVLTHAGAAADAIDCNIFLTFWMKTSEQS